MNKKEAEREYIRTHPLQWPVMWAVAIVGFQKIYADIGLLLAGEPFNRYGYLLAVIVGAAIAVGQALERGRNRPMISEQHARQVSSEAAPSAPPHEPSR